MPKFIMSKKTYEFTEPYSDKTLKIPAQFIGTVPDWVPETWLFQAAVKEASITFVGNRQPESIPETTVPEPPTLEPPTQEEQTVEVPEGSSPEAPEHEEPKGKKKA